MKRNFRKASTMLSLAIVASLTLTTPVMAATNTSIAKLQEEQKAHNQKIHLP